MADLPIEGGPEKSGPLFIFGDQFSQRKPLTARPEWR
jgi:hypothetical protein